MKVNVPVPLNDVSSVPSALSRATAASLGVGVELLGRLAWPTTTIWSLGWTTTALAVSSVADEPPVLNVTVASPVALNVVSSEPFAFNRAIANCSPLVVLENALPTATSLPSGVSARADAVVPKDELGLKSISVNPEVPKVVSREPLEFNCATTKSSAPVEGVAVVMAVPRTSILPSGWTTRSAAVTAYVAPPEATGIVVEPPVPKVVSIEPSVLKRVTMGLLVLLTKFPAESNVDVVTLPTATTWPFCRPIEAMFSATDVVAVFAGTFRSAWPPNPNVGSSPMESRVRPSRSSAIGRNRRHRRRSDARRHGAPRSAVVEATRPLDGLMIAIQHLPLVA